MGDFKLRRIPHRRERRNKILDILDEDEKATFETLLREVKCGRATLSKDLKMLIRGDIIHKFEDVKDSRIKWYEKIVQGSDDRVKAEKGKYFAIDFIENLRAPVYTFYSKDGKKTISAFMSPVEDEFRQKAQKMMNGMVKKKLMHLVFSTYTRGLEKNKKIAVIITLKG